MFLTSRLWVGANRQSQINHTAHHSSSTDSSHPFSLSWPVGEADTSHPALCAPSMSVNESPTRAASKYSLNSLGTWPQSFMASEVRLLIVPLPGFGWSVCLAGGGGRAAVPGVPGCAPAPTAPGWSSFCVGGVVRAGQAGAGRAQSRCQQVRNASFQGQSGLMVRVRCRAWRARRAGMCQIR